MKTRAGQHGKWSWVVATIALALVGPRATFAWGNVGHRIVAQIGDDRLSDTARRGVARIAGDRPLALLATWPDFIRSEPAWDFAQMWHYLTVDDWQKLSEGLEQRSLSPQGADDPVLAAMPHNVVEGIHYFSAILRGEDAPKRNFEKLLERHRARLYDGSLELTALSFLVHLIGDIHQPLHVGRGGDQGGNQVSVNWFGEVTSLHTVWDTLLIESQGLSYSEFARFLEAELGDETTGAAQISPEVWAQESLDYRHRVYQIYQRTSRDNHLPDLGYRYAHDHQRQLQIRLFQGGRRVAGLLSSIFE